MISSGSSSYQQYFASLISSANNSGLISKSQGGFSQASLIAGLVGN